MKTSELRKIVGENLYKFEKIGDFIYIHYLGLKAMILDLRNNSITVDNGVRLTTPCIKKIMVALIEYSLTPLNEREDEKKYRIMIDNAISAMNECLTLRVTKNTYYFSIFDNNDGLFQRIFTQSEVDNFPTEIKGAIECGFLKMFEAKE